MKKMTTWSAEWEGIESAPPGVPVIVWIPPVVLSPAVTIQGRMEIGLAYERDPRSGKLVQKYPKRTLWTFAPRQPRQRIKGTQVRP